MYFRGNFSLARRRRKILRICSFLQRFPFEKSSFLEHISEILPLMRHFAQPTYLKNTQYTQSQQIFCKVGCRCAFLFVSMVRSSFCSTLSFTVDSSLGVLVPYVSPHDLYHALTYQQNDFQRFWGRKIEEKKCGWEAKCVSEIKSRAIGSGVIYRNQPLLQAPLLRRDHNPILSAWRGRS